jgi:metal-responsive CopG/Arc/MetJ family transcriptional regulator
MAQKKLADRNERLQIMLDEDELAALDDWRFAMRMPSRAAAIRELLRRGLADRHREQAKAGEKSSGFGVTKKTDVTRKD